MKQFFLLLCLHFFLDNAYAHYHVPSRLPEVYLSLGRIQGSLMKSRLNKTIYAFRGIRFAEAPVGDLRFKEPVPIKPWNDVLDASEEGPGCPQSDLDLQSEDCLRLNVYTTKLPSSNSEVKRPVIVFLHPGGFSAGSGQSIYAGPNYIMDQDIVFVTINYRLGALGFFNTGDALAPGNLGLKDQIVGLRWVRGHITKFGGDPNSVTIAGCSAGAGSVAFHLVSPMARGLFHRAIAMSGAATFQTPIPHNQKELAIRQADVLGCPSDTTENIISCLRNKTVEEIGNSLPGFTAFSKEPARGWGPVVEPDLPGLERFLIAEPIDLIREGKFHHVPVIAGITAEEVGDIVTIPINQSLHGDNSMFDDINANWTEIAPVAFFYDGNTENSAAISEELRRFYLHNEPVGVNNWRGLSQLCSDAVIGFSVHRFVNAIAAASSAPVWYYDFTYQGRYTFSTWPDDKPLGAGHQDDLIYLLRISIMFPAFEDGAPENIMVEKLTAIWANFAKTGQPIPTDNDLFKNVRWPRFTPQNKKYLDIGEELIMKTGLYEDRMNVWEKLFPLG